LKSSLELRRKAFREKPRRKTLIPFQQNIPYRVAITANRHDEGRILDISSEAPHLGGPFCAIVGRAIFRQNGAR